MKIENELEDKDVIGKDLLISLGGDNTFLRSQSTIKNSYDTAIIGINSHAKHQKAKLCDTTIDFDSYKD